MPNIVVQVVPGLSAAEKSQFGERIANAANAAFGLPPDRVNIYFDETPHYRGGVLTENFERRDDDSDSAPTTTFWVNTTAGKTVEQKRILVDHLAEAVNATLGTPRDAVVAYINEEVLENVAKGGSLFSDK